MSTGRGWVMTPEEKAAALAEAKTRGLPDGWRVELDKRKRRKWIAPNNRSCDSIPKALAISVELGMLPPDTVLPKSAAKRKRGRPPKSKSGKNDKKKKKKPGRKPKISLDLTKPAGHDGSDDEEESDSDDEVEEASKKRKSSKSKKKKSEKKESAKRSRAESNVSSNAEGDGEEGEDAENSDDEQELEVEEPTDPETSLDFGSSYLTTVHWDPENPACKKIGWRIRIADDKHGDWKVGRIVRYDPCTHKHKIQFTDKPRAADKVDNENCTWLYLRMEEGVQISTRLVWAHVKGYAWWPAMAMESDVNPNKEGYISVEFFGSDEVATLREGPESLRPFENGQVDSVIAKNKKKRNSNAIALAIEEERAIQNVRNEAAKFFAKKAWEMCNKKGGGNYLGNRIRIWRDDVNYPYGDTVAGRVRQYSESLNKWLVSYEMSDKVRKKYESSWVDLKSKGHKLRVLEKANPDNLSDIDILPFLKGFKYTGARESDTEEDNDENLDSLIKKNCSGCGDYWKKNETRITCTVCNGSYHLGCCDPPLTKEAYQKIKYGEDTSFVCSKCVTCVGCYQRDISFGSHRRAAPKCLSFQEGKDLNLCSMCTHYYEEEQFCPNCAHSWDDERFQQAQRQIRWQQQHRPKKRGRKRKSEVDDPASAVDYHSFTSPATVHKEDPFPEDATVNPAWYYPETSKWGYTEVDMLTCDNCSLWVHAGCAGLSEDEYDLTSSGDHPIYSTEFLCRVCCRERSLQLIYKMQQEDRLLIFADPVTDQVAPTYLDVIKQPMDLQTMLIKAERDEYRNYAWVRELFELMVLNALTFNRYHTAVWIEAKRFYDACIGNIFKEIGKGAPPSSFENDIMKNFEKAKEAKKLEEDRIQEDKTIEKKDLVAGSKVVSVTLPALREKAPDLASCVPCHVSKLKPKDAYYSAWQDSCFTCGSSGASDTMIFCVDCGEAFHSFCVNAPIHSMDSSSVAAWRCPNCKICEISGDAPQDELKMLFCEMCDRGFNLDLLDPPLSKAPSGMWICGQCVDCRKCGNSLEPKGASLKHWSRNPHLCYRCGGCNGLPELEQHLNERKCLVCSGISRDEDEDLAQCKDCKAKIHAHCDPKADAYLKKLKNGDGKDTKGDKKSASYSCPHCSKKQSGSKAKGKVTRDHMADFASKVVSQGLFIDTGNNLIEDSELQEKLMEQVDWKTRNLWRDEYRKVVLEGVRFMKRAEEQFGDPRYLMDRFWQENEDLPPWMGHRATRFLHIASKLKFNSVGFSARRIENCVMISKLAASWLKVACSMMGLKTKKNIKGHERVMKLLVAPHACGSVDLAYDSIRCERNRNIISKDDWIKIYEPKLKPQVQSAVFDIVTPEEEKKAPDAVSNVQKEKAISYKVAQPLCGWNHILKEVDMTQKWSDPRECCLCHLCGDDDAGLADDIQKQKNERNKPNIARLGRLLPMGDGLWVHTACALWSSETWEAKGGCVTAMEKARSRGAQLRCFGCGRPGATVGCIKPNCSHNYHFPCAFATGAVFTSSKQVLCADHKEFAENSIENPSSESMESLVVAQEKSKASPDKDADDASSCPRYGALLVHTLGEIEQSCDGFHTEDYIMPVGYTATRIFWSTVKAKERTVYVLKIEKLASGNPLFSITPGDDPMNKIKASSARKAYDILMDRVLDANTSEFSHGDLYSKLATERMSSKKFFGLNGPQFYGFGLDQVRKVIEALPGTEAVVTKLNPSSPQYLFCYLQPSVDSIMDLQRRRAALAAEKKLENASGCARTEGIGAVTRSGGSDRITRALVRNAENEENADVGAQSVNAGGKKRDMEKVKADRSKIQRMYRGMKAIPIEQRLAPKRSHIHGWGLFTKVDLPKDSMIVEYMGEVIRKSVADAREKAYEISGEGSCYMFRLDLNKIVDATKIGCMARFMNHCCQPNAYAKVIAVDTDYGQENKIVIFSNIDIKAGEEITYDYKFPVEDGSLKCTCGAPNCIGRLN
mmetsp:Transcript_19405/g.48327  ORF Transcript_19405/g.48327 Transcript_19405/m.48327 type:complete len:1968 (+) Transcript_19405:387-6290(+)